MSGSNPIRVLVVDDDPLACEAHIAYVRRVPGFVVAGSASNAAAALKFLAGGGVDLVLLDMNLPDRHGLEIIRTMKAARHPADVIAVTSARELETVRTAVSQGIVQYLLKPFSFATLRERLERYASYRQTVTAPTAASGQAEVDQLLAGLRGASPAAPAGLLPQTLESVVNLLRELTDLSAAELADRLGTSRVTARRYLEHLVDTGAATRDHRYQGTGRPVVAYRWRSPG
ncbi:response regulator [Nakamurella silvestris]|nr:response regulator [Nakamurella silvestris]